MVSLFWSQVRELLDTAVPLAAQAALFFLIVRFALAVAGLLLDLAASARPMPQPNSAQPLGNADALPPQLTAGPARPGIPERASS